MKVSYRPVVIFVAFESGTGGNALAAFINGMIDPNFVSEICFSRYGNAHPSYDKRGNSILTLGNELNWESWMANDRGENLIDKYEYNEDHIRTNPNTNHFVMRENYTNIDHIVKKIEDGVFNGKLVYIYNNKSSDDNRIRMTNLLFKDDIDCYCQHGEYWWRQTLKELIENNIPDIVNIDEIETLHPLDCSADRMEKIVSYLTEVHNCNRTKKWTKRTTEHELVLQVDFRDIYSGNPEILDKLSKFLDLPIPEGLDEKLALYASLQPSVEKYRKERGEI